MAEPPHHLHCRAVLYLDAPEPLRCLHDPFREAFPVQRGIGALPAVHVILPAHLPPGGAEPMPHVQADAETHRPA